MLWLAEDPVYISQKVYKNESEHAASMTAKEHTIHAVDADLARYHHWEILHHHIYCFTQRV